MRIAIVDDAPIWLEMLQPHLPPNIEVVGVAGSPQDAMRVALLDKPDMMVLDIQFGDDKNDTTGLRLARDIRRHAPDIGLLLLSIHDEPAYLQRLLAIEANGPRRIGYAVKNRGDLSNLVAAILQVGSGNVSIDPFLGERLERRHGATLDALLTESERNVLKLLATGLSSQAISRKLSISKNTVESYISTIGAKLNLPRLREPEREDINLRVSIVLRYLGITPA